jgi:hypothetical protein
MPNPFAVLGVAETADDDAIKKAYLQQVREHPPERNAGTLPDDPRRLRSDQNPPGPPELPVVPTGDPGSSRAGGARPASRPTLAPPERANRSTAATAEHDQPDRPEIKTPHARWIPKRKARLLDRFRAYLDEQPETRPDEADERIGEPTCIPCLLNWWR